MKRPLLDATFEDLKRWVTDRGHPAYRARQVWRWAWQRRADQFALMSDVPKALREALDAEWKKVETVVSELLKPGK